MIIEDSPIEDEEYALILHPNPLIKNQLLVVDNKIKKYYNYVNYNPKMDVENEDEDENEQEKEN